MLSESAPRSIRIEVTSSVVRFALQYVADTAGWVPCTHAAVSCACITICDRVPTEVGGVDVLVTRDEPAACQAALEATVDARVRAIVLWNSPEDLRPACEGIDADLAVIPRRVIELGALAPRLTRRQMEVLRLLAKGNSSGGIAGALRQSESTAKRDIAELLHVFDVPNRAALVSTAASLGFVAQSLSDPNAARPEVRV